MCRVCFSVCRVVFWIVLLRVGWVWMVLVMFFRWVFIFSDWVKVVDSFEIVLFIVC